MLPGYADSHVHSGIVSGLLRRGMDVVRVQDRGQCGVEDEIILATAAAEGRLMLTNDDDFLRIHSAWQAAGRSHAGIVFWAQNRYPIGEVIRRIELYAAHTSPAQAANVVKYL
jgi:Domain of unknown function (DUF5615)